MPGTPYHVRFTVTAQSDLEEIESYWIRQGEAERGDQYFRDLASAAVRELSDPLGAARGRRVNARRHPGARELLAFGIYRILYEIDEASQTVNVLRFWHAHRGAPPLS